MTGWLLKDGTLYLLVKCEGGTIREVTIERNASLQSTKQSA